MIEAILKMESGLDGETLGYGCSLSLCHEKFGDSRTALCGRRACDASLIVWTSARVDCSLTRSSAPLRYARTLRSFVPLINYVAQSKLPSILHNPRFKNESHLPIIIGHVNSTLDVSSTSILFLASSDRTSHRSMVRLSAPASRIRLLSSSLPVSPSVPSPCPSFRPTMMSWLLSSPLSPTLTASLRYFPKVSSTPLRSTCIRSCIRCCRRSTRPWRVSRAKTGMPRMSGT